MFLTNKKLASPPYQSQQLLFGVDKKSEEKQ